MCGSVKWIVDLHKRSLVALYEKNSKPVRSRGLELYSGLHLTLDSAISEAAI